MYVVQIYYEYDIKVVYGDKERKERRTDFASVVVPRDDEFWQQVAVAQIRGKAPGFELLELQMSWLAGYFKSDMP